MRVKKKRYSFTRNCESARGGGPRGGRWFSTASLGATLEVAEVVQGVEDELPLRGILAVVVLIP